MKIKYIGNPIHNNREGLLSRRLLYTISNNFDTQLEIVGDTECLYLCGEDDKRALTRLSTRKIPYDTVIHHSLCSRIEIEPRKVNIGIVECKTSTIPIGWVNNLRKLDYILTTSELNRSMLLEYNSNTISINPPISSTITNTKLPDGLRDIKYLMIPERSPSNNWVNGIIYFIHTFTYRDPVTLIVCTDSNIVKSAISNLMEEESPQVVIISGDYSGILSKVNYMYNPYRGSGIDILQLSSLSVGTPVICTRYGPPTTYNNMLIPYTKYPSSSSKEEPDYDESLLWATPTGTSMILDNSMRTTWEAKLPREFEPDIAIQDIVTKLENIPIKSPPSSIEVSIIVLNYNNLPMTKKCMEALEKYTDKGLAEIILLENGSNQDDSELFNYLKTLNCTVLYVSPNIGFSGGNNYATKYARGKIILFLNNDTEVQENWLEPIVKNFQDSNVGIVGSRLVFPNWTIQHIGISFSEGDKYYSNHQYSGESYNIPQAEIRREVHAVTGACLAIRRDLLEELGGFDSSYTTGYYEDADLCLRVRDLGYKVIYEPDSIVVHKHGQTFRKLGDVTTQDFYKINQQLFKDRHGKKVMGSAKILKSNHHYERGRKNIGILDSYIGTLGGGEKVVAMMAQALESTSNIDILTRINKIVTSEDINRRFNVDISNTELVYIEPGEEIKYYRDYDIFINSEWGSREAGQGRYNIYNCMFPQRIEKEALDTYDKIIAISEYTRDNIKKLWRRDSTVIYPPVTMMSTIEEAEILLSRKASSIISVGRFFEGGHCKKHKVMIEAMKKLSRDFPDTTLHLVGALSEEHKGYYEECVELARGYQIEFHTNIEFEEIRRLYRSSSIYWHAAGYGETNPTNFEHFGIAPVEAISAGCYPILFNGGGLRELARDFTHWNTIEELVDITGAHLEVGSNKELVEELIVGANRYSDEVYNSSIVKLIGEV